MRLTRYGRPFTCALFLALIVDLVAAVVIAYFSHVLFGILFAVVCIPPTLFMLAFFRDPIRKADTETLSDRILYAPADGKVTEISEYEDARFNGPVIRIGIFLSIFDVHINRSPCHCTVVSVECRNGQFLDARDPRSSEANTSADLMLEPKHTMVVKLPEQIVVRQIVGTIARRIVCDVRPGDELTAGQRFGMIRFGSRTELIVPRDDAAKVLVVVGQKVHAGDDPLIEYR